MATSTALVVASLLLVAPPLVAGGDVGSAMWAANDGSGGPSSDTSTCAGAPMVSAASNIQTISGLTATSVCWGDVSDGNSRKMTCPTAADPTKWTYTQYPTVNCTGTSTDLCHCGENECKAAGHTWDAARAASDGGPHCKGDEDVTKAATCEAAKCRWSASGFFLTTIMDTYMKGECTPIRGTVDLSLGSSWAATFGTHTISVKLATDSSAMFPSCPDLSSKKMTSGATMTSAAGIATAAVLAML